MTRCSISTRRRRQRNSAMCCAGSSTGSTRRVRKFRESWRSPAASIRFGDVLPHGRGRSGAGLYLLAQRCLEGDWARDRPRHYRRGDAGRLNVNRRRQNPTTRGILARSTARIQPHQAFQHRRGLRIMRTGVVDEAFAAAWRGPSGDRDCRLRSGILGSPCGHRATSPRHETRGRWVAAAPAATGAW